MRSYLFGYLYMYLNGCSKPGCRPHIYIHRERERERKKEKEKERERDIKKERWTVEAWVMRAKTSSGSVSSIDVSREGIGESSISRLIRRALALARMLTTVDLSWK